MAFRSQLSLVSPKPLCDVSVIWIWRSMQAVCGGISCRVTVWLELPSQPDWFWPFSVRTSSVLPLGDCKVAVAELSPRKSSPPVPTMN